MGARDIIRKHLIDKGPGYKFTNSELQQMTGIIESVRRLRELRDQEGFNILSYRDDPSLKANEYMVGDPIQVPVKPNQPSKREFAMHLATHPWCDSCKKMAGDRRTKDPSTLVKLNVHKKTDSEFLVLCTDCEGKIDDTVPYFPVTFEERVEVAPRHIKKVLLQYLTSRSVN